MSAHVSGKDATLHTFLKKSLLFFAQARQQPLLFNYFEAFCEVELFLYSLLTVFGEARCLLGYVVFIIKAIVGIVMT